MENKIKLNVNPEASTTEVFLSKDFALEKNEYLEYLGEKLWCCPICGEHMDFSEEAKKLNEFDEHGGTEHTYNLYGEKVLGLRNGTTVFRYVCGHKLIIYPSRE